MGKPTFIPRPDTDNTLHNPLHGPSIQIRIPDRIPTVRPSVVITFDDVAADTIIDTHYADTGVTFAAVLVGKSGKGHVYARNMWNAESAPNGVTIIDPSIWTAFFDDATGYVEAHFDSPHRWVSIDALPLASPDDLRPITAKPYLEAYDASGKMLRHVPYTPNHGDGAWGTWQRLKFDAGSAAISTVRIGSERGTGCPVYGLFDQLSFSMEPQRR